MRQHHMWRRFALLVLLAVLFFVWLGQQQYINSSILPGNILPGNIADISAGDDVNLGEISLSDIRHDGGLREEKENDGKVKENSGLVGPDTTTVNRFDVWRVSEGYTVRKEVESKNDFNKGQLLYETGRNYTIGEVAIDSQNISINHQVHKNETETESSYRNSHHHPLPIDHSSTIVPVIKQQEADYDAEASLILIQKRSQNNFVKLDADNVTAHKHPSDSALTLNKTRPHSDVGRLKFSLETDLSAKEFDGKPKEKFEHSKRHQSNFDRNEFDSFAKIESLPEYDLPILDPKEVANASSTTRPSFMNPTHSFHLSNDSLKSSVTDGRENDAESLTDDAADDIMSSAVILGEINPDTSYAVFSATTENRASLGFIFLLPLTTMAWKRIGFDSIVIVVGSVDTWNSDELFHMVLSAVRELGAVVVFIEPRPEKSVMISQVSRIFIANILRAHAAIKNRHNPYIIDDVYVITTDADIWPIYGDVYKLPHNKDILSLNSECCGAFSHRDVTYRMLPMANIGMRIGLWRKLTRKFGESPRSVDDILTFVVREFGPVALRPVRKGDNVGWFLDQMMISILLAAWTKDNGVERVKFIPRDVGVDRLDRGWWGPGVNGGIEDRIDAHLLLDAYLPGTWVLLVPLLRSLYGGETDRYVWCIRYYDSFERLFVNKYRTGGGHIDDKN